MKNEPVFWFVWRVFFSKKKQPHEPAVWPNLRKNQRINRDPRPNPSQNQGINRDPRLNLRKNKE